MNSMSSGCYVVDEDFNVIFVNDTATNIYPQLEVGKKCYKCLMNLDEPCGPCPVVNRVKGPRTYVDPIRKISESVDSVDINIDEYGLCHALVFSTVGLNEELAATLPLSSEELTNLALIKALTIDCYDVFSVNLSSGEVTMFRHNNKPIDSANFHGEKLIYEDALRQYISSYIPEDEKEIFLQNNSLKHIREQLSNEEYMMNHYRVTIDGISHYYARKISRIGNPENFDNIVIGVSCEDEIVLGKQKTKELERKIAEIEYNYRTGLYTREAFVLRSQSLIEHHPDVNFDFCICRIENLGMINHQYGKDMGDSILKIVGQLLALRDNELFCIGYLGDGVYASFTPNTPRDEREAATMDFRREIFQASPIKEISLKWSIYTDVSRDLSIENIIQKAVYALSTIRQNTHQDYIEFDQSVIDRMEIEFGIENSFEESLANGEFVAWYQPKYSIKTGEITGAEALVRWVTPDGNRVSPADFIPVLERLGKIDMLDEYIFREVCKFKHKLKDSGMGDISISVNLSRASLFKRDIAAIYSQIASEYEIETSSIPIEITESAAVRASSIQEFAKRLTELGFVLHMDDFGSGYSSLVSLLSIPFECIKFDKSITDKIGNENTNTLLKHTVSFAKECGMRIIAEGVETYEQTVFLRAIGCDMAQGYYYSKPVDEETFRSMIL